jgi:hypothetical protein
MMKDQNVHLHKKNNNYNITAMPIFYKITLNPFQPQFLQ